LREEQDRLIEVDDPIGDLEGVASAPQPIDALPTQLSTSDFRRVRYRWK